MSSRGWICCVALAWALLAPLGAWAQDSQLESWLKWVEPGVARNDPALVAWRRAHPDLETKLVEVAIRQASQVEARRGAIHALAAAGDSLVALNALRKLAADPSLAKVAGAAVRRIPVRRALLVQLGRVRAHALAPAGSAGAKTLEELARSLDAATLVELSPLIGDRLLDRGLRAAGARLLAWSGEAEPAIDELVRVARDDPFAGTLTRNACLLALAARGAEGRLLAVCLALRGSPQDWDLLRQGVSLLEANGSAFRTFSRKTFQVGEAAPDLQVLLAIDLAERQATGVVPFLSKLVKEGRGFDPHEHLRLALALIRLDRSALAANVPRLVEAALSSQDVLADGAVAALDELRPPQLKAALEPVFRRPDPSGDLRVRAVQLIELLTLNEFAPLLGELLSDEKVPWSTRQAAAHALGRLGGKSSVQSLAHALRKTEAPTGEASALRREIADALAACEPRDAQGRQALEGAIDHPEPTVRRAVLRALAAYGDPRSAVAVRRLLERDPRSGVECTAILETAVALDMFGPQSAQRLLALRSHGLTAALGVVAYARHLEASLAIDALIDLLDHPVGQVRSVAASELLRRYPQGRSFGYHLARGAQERGRAIEAWRRAWREQAAGFR